MSYQAAGVSIYSTILPIDYNEYVTQVYTSEEEAIDYADVAPDKSLQFSMRPANTTTLSSTTKIFATFGKSIA